MGAERAREQRDPVHLRDKVTLWRQDATGKVEHLVDHGTHGRAGHDDAHLVHGSQKLALDDLLGHGIGGHARCLGLESSEPRLGSVASAHRPTQMGGDGISAACQAAGPPRSPPCGS